MCRVSVSVGSLPWKHKVSNSYTIPIGMVKKPIAASPIVHKVHDSQTYSTSNTCKILKSARLIMLAKTEKLNQYS